MALLESCFCVSLLVATVVSGAATMVVYLVAFALELWWIIESNGKIQAPAYVLCVGYFLIFLTSVIMIAGIIGHKTRCLLVWLFSVVVFYLPEAGLVLYMSIKYWTIGGSMEGRTELIFWICRALMNIATGIVVQSQYSTWREEKQVIKQLNTLKMTPSPLSDGINKSLPLTNALVLSTDSQYNRCYENLGFTSTTEMRPAILINGNDLQTANGRIQRSVSSASQLQQPRPNSFYGGSLPDHHPDVQDSWHQIHPRSSYSPHYSAMNESGAFGFNQGIFPIDSNFELDPKSGVQLHSYRPRSLMYLDEDDYLTRPPPSRAVSLNYINLHPTHSTQSLDRAKYLPKDARRTTSLDALDMCHPHDVHLQKLPMKPFDYLNRPGSKQSEMDSVSDDAHKIGDVAL